MEFIELVSANGAQPRNYEQKIMLDCANGVGALPMMLITNRIRNYIDI